MEKIILTSLNFLVIIFGTTAQDVLGIWKNIDDVSGQAKSHIELYLKDGKLFGKVIELLPAATTTICNDCPGEKAGKSLIGMDIVWNMLPKAKGWESGQIVDPKNGKVYNCFMELETPDRLNVRGYVGISLFGRSQYWYRVK